MKIRLLDFLVCPIDKSELKLIVWEEKVNKLSEDDLHRISKLNCNKQSFEREIISGVLKNINMNIYYPIYKGVPRMLTYSSGVLEDFRREFKDRIESELKGFSSPSFAPPLGEESVIRSFSTEWLEYDWDPNKYWKTDSNTVYKSMRYMLDIDNKPIENKSVLEVGIGIGGIANYFSSVEKCELVGIDLSYAVDGAYRNFNDNIFFHIVQASAFNLPLKDYAFDYIYSHGVLHHSSDPKICFQNVSKTPKKDGYFYLWLYNDKSENQTLFRRILMIIEKIFRPIIYPLPQSVQKFVLIPIALLYFFHQNILKANDKNLVRYTYREALHAARDRFTPKYAFRYSEKEVISWFEDAGFYNIKPSAKTSHPDYLTRDFYVATVMIAQRK